jgi:hypothetical protein
MSTPKNVSCETRDLKGKYFHKAKKILFWNALESTIFGLDEKIGPA